MAANQKIAPPPGFKLDSLEPEELPPLPEGFEVDQAPRRTPIEMRNGLGQDEGKLGLAEAALSQGTGLLGTVAGGIAGLATMNPENVGKVQGALTYQPRTESGQAVNRAISAIPSWLSEKFHDAGGAVSDATGSPALGTATNVTLNAIPALVSRGARPLVNKRIGELSDRAAMNAPADTTLVRGQQLGFKALPDTFVGRQAAKVGGEDAVKQFVQRDNQEMVDKVAREEAGLGPKDAITRENLESVRDVMEAPYKKIASISSTAAQALDDMKTFRRKKQMQMDYYRTTRNPDAWEKAEEFRRKEEYYDRVVEYEAKRVGDPKLVQELKEARVRLAKNHTVEEALNEGAGIVNARYFAALDKKTKGNLLTGKLKDVASWAQAHPETIAGKPVHMPGATHMEAAESVAAGMMGHGGLAMGLPFLRGGARSIALSKLAQPGPTRAGLGLRLSDIATGTRANVGAGMIPGIGLRPPEE